MKRLLFFITLLVTLFGFITTTSAVQLDNELSIYHNVLEQEVLNEDISHDLSEETNNSLETDNSDIGLMWDMPVPKNGDKNYKLLKGDILISNATSYKGITGHAGIAISSTQVLHIAGPGAKPKVMPLTDWIKRYGTGYKPGITATWVYRTTNRTIANQAGQWAIDNYKDKIILMILLPQFMIKTLRIVLK